MLVRARGGLSERAGGRRVELAAAEKSLKS